MEQKTRAKNNISLNETIKYFSLILRAASRELKNIGNLKSMMKQLRC